MSKRVKYFPIAGCELPGGKHLGLRRVEDRAGAALIGAHLELRRGETVLATGPADIEAALRQLGLKAGDLKWLLDHLSEAVKS